MQRPVAVITGASRGIGAATARALGSTHRAELIGRDADALGSVAAELPDAGVHAGDIAEPEIAAELAARFPRVDVLVHSAGVAEILPLAQTSYASWERTMRVNVLAVAEFTRLLLPTLRENHADVVLINSGQGRNASPEWGAYAASKFALRAYADVLRTEEPALRVTTVYPGRTATEMQRGVRAAEGRDFEPEQYLRPESVADAVRTAVTAGADAAIPEIVIRPNR
ncbi:SDR family oxidoreductase [Sciscionella marina]|uniref:SDR family oxidoreductase n=1 Tax=Sciscionella marina TaxID=508770 RepID=UPI000363A396|nr:SDR family oxidoreductase [Sciscionella marina]